MNSVIILTCSFVILVIAKAAVKLCCFYNLQRDLQTIVYPKLRLCKEDRGKIKSTIATSSRTGYFGITVYDSRGWIIKEYNKQKEKRPFFYYISFGLLREIKIGGNCYLKYYWPSPMELLIENFAWKLLCGEKDAVIVICSRSPLNGVIDRQYCFNPKTGDFSKRDLRGNILSIYREDSHGNPREVIFGNKSKLRVFDCRKNNRLMSESIFMEEDKKRTLLDKIDYSYDRIEM